MSFLEIRYGEVLLLEGDLALVPDEVTPSMAKKMQKVGENVTRVARAGFLSYAGGKPRADITAAGFRSASGIVRRSRNTEAYASIGQTLSRTGRRRPQWTHLQLAFGLEPALATLSDRNKQLIVDGVFGPVEKHVLREAKSDE